MGPGIFLCDDHQIVRQGLKSLLEGHGFRVVGEASDGLEAVRMVKEIIPEVAILDLSMPLLNGLDGAKEIQKISPDTKAIVLTMHSEDHYVLKALRMGVRGYVLKTKAAEELIQAIRAVLRGEVFLSSGISETVVQAYLSKNDYPQDPLSARENQVLQLVAEGKSTKEIASLLGISIKTADSHRTRIMRKLDIHETAGLVRYAIRQGFIKP